MEMEEVSKLKQAIEKQKEVTSKIDEIINKSIEVIEIRSGKKEAQAVKSKLKEIEKEEGAITKKRINQLKRAIIERALINKEFNKQNQKLIKILDKQKIEEKLKQAIGEKTKRYNKKKEIIGFDEYLTFYKTEIRKISIRNYNNQTIAIIDTTEDSKEKTEVITLKEGLAFKGAIFLMNLAKDINKLMEKMNEKTEEAIKELEQTEDEINKEYGADILINQIEIE